MASREGRAELRVGARLVACVFGASGVGALLEGAALATGCPPVVALAGGALITVPLSLLFGGAHLVRRHAEALRELAFDDLTGVRSRRSFAVDLPEAVEAATRGGRPLTLALIELTSLDAAVELFGRRRAEALIREAAGTLTAEPGRETAAYRLGGEVFAAVLDGVGPDAAFEVTDALLGRLARAAAPLCAVAGLATLDARCPDAELLLVGASAALDEARSLGAGRVAASADPGSGLRWVATPGPSPR